jgi:EpsI family protein
MSRRLLLASLCMGAVAGYLRVAAATDLNPPASRLAALPLEIAGWRGADEPPLDAATAAVLNADAYVLRSYARGPMPVSLFVAYYGTQRSGRTIHSPLNCLPGTGWNWLRRDRETLRATDGSVLDVNRDVARRDATDLVVYYWYQSRGRVVANEFTNKLLLVRDAVTEHRSDGALVRVTVDASHAETAAAHEASTFIATLYPALAAHLPE